jgi:hypothetical protein
MACGTMRRVRPATVSRRVALTRVTWRLAPRSARQRCVRHPLVSVRGLPTHPFDLHHSGPAAAHDFSAPYSRRHTQAFITQASVLACTSTPPPAVNWAACQVAGLAKRAE